MIVTWQGARIDTRECEKLAQRITSDWRGGWLYTEYMLLSPGGKILYYRVGNWRRGMSGECRGWWWASQNYGVSLDGYTVLDREALVNMRLIKPEEA